MGTAAVLAVGALQFGALPANATATSYDHAAPGAPLPNGDTNGATGLVISESGSAGSVWNVAVGSNWTHTATGWLRTFCGQFGSSFHGTGTWTESQDRSPAAARMAWIQSAYPSSPENDAAKAYATHVYYEKSQDQILRILAQTPSGARTAALAEKMWNASAGHTGQYSVKPRLALSDAKSGTVTNTQVSSATGTVAAQVKLTLSGGAVFNATGTSTWSGAAGGSLAWHATKTGPVAVTEETQNLVGGWLRSFTQPRVQRQTATPGVVTVRGVSADVQAKLSFQPQATSTAVAEVKAGQALKDTLHVSARPGSSWIPGVSASFDVAWYFSPTRLTQKDAATPPAGAVLFAKGRGTVAKAGDVVVTADKPAAQAGWYYPVASFTKKAQPAGQQQFFTGDWKAAFNASGEETVEKFSPQVVTQASEIKDGKVRDSLIVSGNYAGQTITVVSNLYLATQCKAGESGSEKAPSGAQLLGTVSTDVKGNGTALTPSLDVPWAAIIEAWKTTDAGCLYWQENVAGTEATIGWTGKHQLPKETVQLAKPSIVTKAVGGGTVPVKVRDTGIVSGTIPTGEGVTVATKVDQYRFENAGKPDCVNPVFSSPWQPVTGTGEITYPEHEITREGSYGYVESLKVAVKDKAGKTTETVLHTGECGAPGESVVASAPIKPITPEKPIVHQAPKPAHPAPVQPEVPTGHPVADQASDMTIPAAGLGAGLIALVTGGLVIARNRKTADK